MDGGPKVIAIRPVDTAGLPPGYPKPSIEHTIKPCDECGRDCWIGPTQLFTKTMTGIPAYCYWCLMPVLAATENLQFQTLDKAADDKPRRT